MAKTRTWVCIIMCILLLSIAASVCLRLRPAPGHIASIYVEGRLVRRIDLEAVTVQTRFTVETEWGVNVIVAQPGRIRVESADCPDGVCVQSGWLSDSASPIVCLPHRLVIELSGDAPVDAEVG